MTRQEIITGLKNYFCIEELVDKLVFDKYGEKAWMFFDTDLLHTIWIIRKHLDKSITINNWKWGGKFDERGLRYNLNYIVKQKTIAGKMYLSMHLFGKAIDFDVEGMTAEEVRDWIVDNSNLFRCKIRLEWKYSKTGKPITWVHLDTRAEDKNPKVYRFNI